MMKRALFVFAAVALIASTAMAVPTLVAVTPLGTATTSDARAVTPDGKYVVGTGAGNTTGQNGWIWDATNGTRGPLLAGSYMDNATGVAYRTNPTSGAQELVIGGKMSSGQVGMFISTDAGTSWTRPFATAGSAPGTGVGNSVGASGGDAYIGWAEGTTAYSISHIGGDPITTDTSGKSVTQKNQIWGVSNNGRAAAARKDAVQYRNLWLGYVAANGTATQNFFNGLAGDAYGVASAMSGDGAKVFGQSPLLAGGGFTTANPNYPYMYDIASNTITALPVLPGTTGSSSLGFVYGASADGRYAVGMDYAGMERAVLWDTQLGTVLDLTDWARSIGGTTGILGIFDGNLRRAYSVGVDADGNPVIAGMGFSNMLGKTRGFVLTIPEPTSVLFLAVGGLALLRRRTR